MGRTPEGKAEIGRRHNLLKKYAATDTQVGIEDVDDIIAVLEQALAGA